MSPVDAAPLPNPRPCGGREQPFYTRLRAFIALLVCPPLGVGCKSEQPPAEPCVGSGVICHVAGSGDAGFNGDGQAAAATAFYLPSAARPGPDGRLYVMDFNNMRLRFLLEDGTVDTVVGNGLHAVATAGAPARDTGLENPIDFAFAPDGLLAFVSVHDPRVLRVTREGTLEVVAGNIDVGNEGDGGPASGARFTELASIAIAPDGSIFVSDDEAHRVRVIRPDGTIHAYAGTGEAGYAGDGGPATDAQLDHPEGLAVDAAGHLFIADTLNHRIRRVDAATGVIETIAGRGTSGLSGDGGPAKAAELKWPSGISVAPDGTVFIADTFNHRIRSIAADGVIDTIAGTTEGRAGDGGPATAAALHAPGYLHATDTDVYVADMQNHVVRVIHR